MPRKPVEVNQECGQRLKLLLKERNITQKDLAARLGYEFKITCFLSFYKVP